MASNNQPTPQLTEERLRTWLDATQSQRERLCVAVLPLLGPYSYVQPRRPKGGPDQARDLEAIMDDSVPVWGAVGFRNQVSDSPQDRKWVSNKFKSDLLAARAENPQLTAFVFFTNVDVRQAEVRSLKAFAAKHGISHCEVFYRERIRQALDTVQGMPYRLQYLGVQMSLEDQLAFFHSFGADLRTILETQHRSIDQRLGALDFWLASVRPLRRFWIIIQLDRSYSFEELGHFRFSLKFGDENPVVFAGRDKVIRHKDENGKISTAFGMMTSIRLPTRPAPLVFMPNILNGRHSRLIFQFDPFSAGAIRHVDELNHMRIEFLATDSISDHATSILLVGNRYSLADVKHYDRRSRTRRDAVPDWPGPLTDSERAVPLLFYGIGVMNFDREAPRKYELTNEDRQNLLY